MTGPDLSPRLAAADEFYADLAAALDATAEGEVPVLLARLVLILANQIGDPAILRAALALARETVSRETVSRETVARETVAPARTAEAVGPDRSGCVAAATVPSGEGGHRLGHPSA